MNVKSLLIFVMCVPFFVGCAKTDRAGNNDNNNRPPVLTPNNQRVQQTANNTCASKAQDLKNLVQALKTQQGLLNNRRSNNKRIVRSNIEKLNVRINQYKAFLKDKCKSVNIDKIINDGNINKDNRNRNRNRDKNKSEPKRTHTDDGRKAGPGATVSPNGKILYGTTVPLSTTSRGGKTIITETITTTTTTRNGSRNTGTTTTRSNNNGSKSNIRYGQTVILKPIDKMKTNNKTVNTPISSNTSAQNLPYKDVAELQTQIAQDHAHTGQVMAKDDSKKEVKSLCKELINDHYCGSNKAAMAQLIGAKENRLRCFPYEKWQDRKSCVKYGMSHDGDLSNYYPNFIAGKSKINNDRSQRSVHKSVRKVINACDQLHDLGLLRSALTGQNSEPDYNTGNPGYISNEGNETPTHMFKVDVERFCDVDSNREKLGKVRRQHKKSGPIMQVMSKYQCEEKLFDSMRVCDRILEVGNSFKDIVSYFQTVAMQNTDNLNLETVWTPKEICKVGGDEMIRTARINPGIGEQSLCRSNVKYDFVNYEMRHHLNRYPEVADIFASRGMGSQAMLQTSTFSHPSVAQAQTLMVTEEDPQKVEPNFSGDCQKVRTTSGYVYIWYYSSVSVN